MEQRTSKHPCRSCEAAMVVGGVLGVGAVAVALRWLLRNAGSSCSCGEGGKQLMKQDSSSSAVAAALGNLAANTVYGPLLTKETLSSVDEQGAALTKLYSAILSTARKGAKGVVGESGSAAAIVVPCGSTVTRTSIANSLPCFLGTQVWGSERKTRFSGLSKIFDMHKASLSGGRPVYRLMDAMTAGTAEGRKEMGMILQHIQSLAALDESGIIMETPCPTTVSTAEAFGFKVVEEFDFFEANIFVLLWNKELQYKKVWVDPKINYS